ncbi:MAG: DUF11 domain-containing protein [Candidatus Andersenbacteria bacterium]|nr:DUF11 domain-containing protein [Candidatus Andersenbacteria bacterium]
MLQPSARRRFPAVVGLITAFLIAAAFVPPLSARAAPACAIPNQTNRTIITVNDRLFADRGAEQAAGATVGFTLQPGAYRVTLMSHDPHSDKTHEAAQLREQWHLVLTDASGATVATTAPISDLPESQDTLVETLDSSLILSRQAKHITTRHSAYPASGPESIGAVCYALDFLGATPSPSPSPTPRPSPSPTPTLSPSPAPSTTATPTQEPADTASDDFSLSITKTDHRTVTRPGHSLTYEIKVRNSGSGTIGDVVITDTLPSTVTVTQISDSGGLAGHTITWPEFALGPDEEKTVFVTVTVKQNTNTGHTLTNNAKARSKDEGISANDIDTTVIDAARAPRVKAATTVQPTPAPSAAVPLTAKTGAGPLAALATLFGGTGLAYTLRHSR